MHGSQAVACGMLDSDWMYAQVGLFSCSCYYAISLYGRPSTVLVGLRELHVVHWMRYHRMPSVRAKGKQ